MSHTLFLKADGSAWATGNNSAGKLGDGTTTERTAPVPVLTGVKAISAGESHSLFLKTDGSVWATGSNSRGEFGNGTTVGSLTPIKVMPPDAPVFPTYEIVAISAGSHSLFLRNDGTAWAAGYNHKGQLGDGTTTRRSTPMMVMADVKAIGGGPYHSLFLKTNGTVWSTGLNNFGELGDGTTTDRSTPVQVMSGVRVIAGGLEHSLFLKTDGMVWASGWNSHGQLGDGTGNHRSTPVPIIQLISNPGMTWKEDQFGEDAENISISGWNEDPDRDGVVNLLERAFNLSPLLADHSILATETGTTGLPLIRTTEGPGGQIISIEYLRRIASTNPGLTCIPQFSSTLQDDGPGGWADVTGTETPQFIDTEWERVTIVETVTGQEKRFGRVKVVSGE